MNSAEWLYTLAVKHERLQTRYLEWRNEGKIEGKIPVHIQGKVDVRRCPTEFVFQDAIITDSPTIPRGLVKLQSDQLLLLAHLFKLTLNGDTHVTGIELMVKLLVDDEHTALAESSTLIRQEFGPPQHWLTGGEIRLMVEQAVWRVVSRGATSLDHDLLEMLSRQEPQGKLDRKQGGIIIGFLTTALLLQEGSCRGFRQQIGEDDRNPGLDTDSSPRGR